jgi:hypothetical protein
LSPQFEAGVVGRYLQTMLQTAAIASAFKTHGQTFGPGITLDTVGAAVDYFQSRRRTKPSQGCARAASLSSPSRSSFRPSVAASPSSAIRSELDRTRLSAYLTEAKSAGRERSRDRAIRKEIVHC